ncbi:MAG: ABC transporter ATP-binding protein [Elainellaceae cyanobacterium]
MTDKPPPLQRRDGATAGPLLKVQDVSKAFGGVQAVSNVSLRVPRGSITGLIGPNGAGKTTLFNLLTNFIPADSGQVLLDGQPIHRLPPHAITHQGLVRTFQRARVLSRLSVLENMMLAAQEQAGENFWTVWLRPRQVAQQEQQQRQRAMEILESVGLDAMAHSYAGALSGGQRKLLEMARSLMVRPKLLLLDEPAAGVNPTLINQICQYIRAWNQAGLSVLLIEHNMDVVMSLCDRIWVLAEGRNLADGAPEEIQQNPDVLEAYLGR